MRLLLPRWLELSKKCIKTDASKYSLSIGCGIIFGILLNLLVIDVNITKLITLPGQLFLRALQCAVVPMMLDILIFFIYFFFSFNFSFLPLIFLLYFFFT